MVALIVGAARAAREEAVRLRGDSQELRLAMRASARTSRTRKATARATLATTRTRSARPHSSPWSGLLWLRDDAALHTVLIRVDD